MCSSPNTAGLAVDRVKTLMAEAEVSQVELSNRTGIERSRLVRRLQGKSPFRVDELEAIASALGCAVLDLLAEAA